jgi:hypothetical protein
MKNLRGDNTAIEIKERNTQINFGVFHHKSCISKAATPTRNVDFKIFELIFPGFSKDYCLFPKLEIHLCNTHFLDADAVIIKQTKDYCLFISKIKSTSLWYSFSG